MKRSLSLLLAIMMLLSCIALAEETLRLRTHPSPLPT